MASLAFDNRFVTELPGDPDASIRPRQVLGAAWSPVPPTPVAAPRLLAWSPECAALLGLGAADLEAPRMVEVLAGNALLEGMRPYAGNYGGHQFGTWAGQLGDGRAITLGEVLTPEGRRWELQLKGAGPTPYSRRADGRAVLRSSLREFLCSEAMHHLGVPTTRALSLVTTGEPVLRDMFYDGHPREEPGAIVCRVAPSFIRFGHFELPAARGDHALLERLVDFTIARDFPHLEGEPAVRRAAWFREVCERTAVLVAHWMRVGFVHGVLNTDNMSILGLTIDYGPYGWIDDFDPAWTPNTTDAVGRRYRFGQQPAVVQWNLVQLAEALVPLFGAPDPLEAGLARFLDVANAELEAMHGAKFGFRQVGERERALVREGFALWHRLSLDMTNGFRALADVAPDAPDAAVLLAHAYEADRAATHREALAEWLGRWGAAIRAGGEPDAVRRARMHAVNPRYVPRNYLAQQAIDAAEQGDAGPLLELLDVLRRPYDEQPGRERYAAPRPEWARHRPGCSMLSCSS